MRFFFPWWLPIKSANTLASLYCHFMWITGLIRAFSGYSLRIYCLTQERRHEWPLLQWRLWGAVENTWTQINLSPARALTSGLIRSRSLNPGRRPGFLSLKQRHESFTSLPIWQWEGQMLAWACWELKSTLEAEAIIPIHCYLVLQPRLNKLPLHLRLMEGMGSKPSTSRTTRMWEAAPGNMSLSPGNASALQTISTLSR